MAVGSLIVYTNPYPAVNFYTQIASTRGGSKKDDTASDSEDSTETTSLSIVLPNDGEETKSNYRTVNLPYLDSGLIGRMVCSDEKGQGLPALGYSTADSKLGTFKSLFRGVDSD
jgi:hypothetical protein